MFIFIKLALGNILKNKGNTITVFTAVFISVFFIMVTVGYMDGFKIKMMGDALKATGHVKIYNTEYYNSLDFAPVEYAVDWDDGLKKRVLGSVDAKSVRPEIDFGAMANSTSDSKETQVLAIDYNTPGDIYDKRKKSIKTGVFPSSEKEAAIGVKMADMLKAKAGDSMVLISMDQYGGINAIELKISGIFRNYNPAEEEGLVICSLTAARKLLNLNDGAVTSVTINIDDPLKAAAAAESIRKACGSGYTVLPWQKIQPMADMMVKSLDIGTYLLAGIILFVAALGIVNSFMMNIMGRYPEFGVLRAMGVSKTQLFLMILSESFLIGLLGTVAGLLPSTALVYYFQVNPLNYEAMGKMLSSFSGLDALIGSAFTWSGFMVTAFTGIFVSVAASVYPGLMAASARPAEILRVLE